MKSKITGGEVTKLFEACVLGKYNVEYFRCVDTGFIQTSPVTWLDEAYSNAITSLDLGLLSRNQNMVTVSSFILERYFDADARFLDYAGGYGVFTRMMRDRGFNFFHYDPFCENLFAKNFDVTREPTGVKYELVSAFEVFEHFDDPLPSIREMAKFSDSILFSTEMVPEEKQLGSVDDWWYFTPETGQHIAFYSRASLEFVAAELDMNFHSNGFGIHLFTRKNLPHNPFTALVRPSLGGYARIACALLKPRILKETLKVVYRRPNAARKSLLEKDFQLARNLAAKSKTDI